MPAVIKQAWTFIGQPNDFGNRFTFGKTYNVFDRNGFYVVDDFGHITTPGGACGTHWQVEAVEVDGNMEYRREVDNEQTEVKTDGNSTEGRQAAAADEAGETGRESFENREGGTDEG